MSLMLQTSTIDAAQPRIARFERDVDHLVNGFVEIVLLESHAMGKGAEQLDVGSAFTERVDRRVGNLKIVVTICGLQVFVFEEGCGWENDVGVVGRVGEKDRKSTRLNSSHGSI